MLHRRTLGSGTQPGLLQGDVCIAPRGALCFVVTEAGGGASKSPPQATQQEKAELGLEAMPFLLHRSLETP